MPQGAYFIHDWTHADKTKHDEHRKLQGRFTHVKTMKQGAILPVGPKLADLLGRYLEEPSASEWMWPGRVGEKPLANLWLRGWPYGAH